MPRSILIVDDSATMRKIIMRTLRMAGLAFDVTEQASNGRKALARLEQGPVVVVLCDINMPEMTSIEFLKQARQLDICKATKLVMVSTESSQELIEQLKGSGTNGCITKPFTHEHFKQTLSPLLN